MNTITVELVANTDGSINQTASVEAFEAALNSYVEQHNLESSTIANAVNAVFDKNLGKGIVLPTLASLASLELHASPENFSSISERVLDFVRSNSKGDNSLFVIGKGRTHGGCRRRADMATA